MGFAEMIIAIVFITAVSNVIRHVVRPSSGRPGVSEARLQEALQQAREETAKLRRENQELILSFDSSLQRLDARLQHLERQALATGEPREALPSVEVGHRAR
jgi:hypothetical protein